MTEVFVSYAHEDEEWARGLAHELSRHGLRVFFDAWDVLPGDVIVHRTDAAISAAASALVVISPASARSPRALEEYAALATAAAERNLRFIPVLIGEAVLPPFAANRVWRDFRGVDGTAYDDKIAELASVLLDEAAQVGPAGPVRRSGPAGATGPAPENLAAVLPTPPRPVTEPARPSLVVCYVSADAGYALALVDQLRTAGLSVWSADDLRAGDPQFWMVRQQLAFATAVIVLMSPQSQDSDDITRMILEGMLHQRPFFPLLLDGRRNYHLAHTWYVDARDGRLLNPSELDLLRDLEAARGGGVLPDEPPLAFPAPRTRPSVAAVRVPAAVSLKRLDTYLSEGELAHADLHTTAILLEAADRLDEGWFGTRHVRALSAEVLAGVDALWSDHSRGRQGLRAQAELAPVSRARHTDFLALSVACGWRDSVESPVPRRYRRLTERAGHGPRRGFYPTLRNPQDEPFHDWYDRWSATVLATHLHARRGGAVP
ncbi:TIR domain-containing protein [Streptomyces clavuligerus]|uniref:Tetratricopeptide TPR_2 repeat protein n=1 Tax=Streptomyces clavuligerus TaxID=1901 RepID=B5GMC2_STRCL|nr:TIR domain-containing protein [Streptomyces clavuligerus]ANW22348.1 hypothetical protein BB341_28890 [Streptomyces clavuligerus]AXU17248.1 TIR domain-containing protein [Streptomyces clavuligerus]EDY47468.1 conserved hypothetical protein [Streptomyces clavuligerus]EFG04431.1 Tetratricopeptide TPR_2 repeat protein [Streptomyces clavuligerus]MBY6307107.1 TIR domain-containing protein [Streptomyces clavuligerus]